jgi:uncharacterized protein YjbI with pentapeptide repeats
MKFKIKNRWSDKVQFVAEIDCDKDTSIDVKIGLAVKWAIKARANLSDANLAGANLARANLADANLADAYLADAYLADAYLAGANLARANLAGANLARAKKIDPADIPVIPNIDAAILAEIERGGVLDMGAWHGPHDHWCGTTHCRAGWAIHIAGEKGKALEDRVGAQLAGTLIYQASRPGVPTPWFFDSNEGALADLRKCAAEQNRVGAAVAAEIRRG